MMQRVFSLLLLLQVYIFAAHYNPTIIELEAKLFPKMLVLSEELKKDAPNLYICIITKETDMRHAQLFKEIIQKNYKEKLTGKNVVVTIRNFDDIEHYPDGIIVLQHTQKEIERIANWANANKIVSFSYDPTYLEHGILASLYIGVSTKPYLNREIIKKYKFRFNPYLLELSKFK